MDQKNEGQRTFSPFCQSYMFQIYQVVPESMLTNPRGGNGINSWVYSSTRGKNKTGTRLKMQSKVIQS